MSVFTSCLALPRMLNVNAVTMTTRLPTITGDDFRIAPENTWINSLTSEITHQTEGNDQQSQIGRGRLEGNLRGLNRLESHLPLELDLGIKKRFFIVAIKDIF